jgi:hypothetical protein
MRRHQKHKGRDDFCKGYVPLCQPVVEEMKRLNEKERAKRELRSQ